MSLFFFILGAIIGSFLNVVALRYGTGMSFLSGNSKCFSCGQKIKWFDLVPIIGFFILGKKCRNCGSKISWQYPLVEIITAFLFYFVFLSINPLIPFDYLLLAINYVIISILILITIYDFRHKIIPDLFVLGFAIFALLLQVLNLGTEIFTLSFTNPLFAGPIIAFPFACLWLASSGKWIGFGDAKLAFAMGWFLGLVGGISAVLLAFWIGAIISVALILISKIFNRWGLSLKSEVPFAPFLIIGTLLVYFFDLNVIMLF